MGQTYFLQAALLLDFFLHDSEPNPPLQDDRGLLRYSNKSRYPYDSPGRGKPSQLRRVAQKAAKGRTVLRRKITNYVLIDY